MPSSEARRSPLKAAPVDPRDMAWEEDVPVYRVYFDGPGAAREYRLTEATDVAEVVAWTDSHRLGNEIASVFVECPAADQPGLARLHRI